MIVQNIMMWYGLSRSIASFIHRNSLSFQAPEFYKNTVIKKCLPLLNILIQEKDTIIQKPFKTHDFFLENNF